MQEFLQLLAEALRQCGMDNVNHHYYSNYIRVGDCYFHCSRNKRGNGFTFEGEKFIRPYNIAKAVGMVIDSLPARLEEAKKQAAYQERQTKAQALNRILKHTCLSVYLNGDDHFALEFMHTDSLTIQAAIDCLQDNGFLTDSPPKLRERTPLDEIKDAYGRLTNEEKLELSEWLTLPEYESE